MLKQKVGNCSIQKTLRKQTVLKWWHKLKNVSVRND